MSKIGQKPIEVPATVSLTVDGNKIAIKGSQGEMAIVLPKKIKLVKQENNFLVERNGDEKKTKSIHGLYRQLIDNAVKGVEKPWEKKLKVVGTGFNVKLDKEDLLFKLGYSHPVRFQKVAGIKFQVEGNTKITVLGSDKQLVGEIAYQIKMLKKPDVYKGKGIQYENEKLRIKPGKKAKTAGPGTAA